MKVAPSKPPLGWNSWNQFHGDIDQQLIVDTAEAIVRTGLRDAGYEYVVIDGGWRRPERDAEGHMQATEAFPDGIEAVADHVHSLGLKLGLHQAVGVRDCGLGSPGTQSAPGGTFLDQARHDIERFADWGIDLLKFDLCNFEFYPESTPAEKSAQVAAFYRAAGQAIAELDRPILYSVSEYGRHEPHRWADDAGAQMWRTTGDLRLRWKGPDPTHFHRLGVLDILDLHEPTAEYARPGFWSDPDMLIVGVTSLDVDGEAPLTDVENRAHLSLWAMLAAPLMAAHDVRTAQPDVTALLTNPELLAIDQDPAGVQGRRVRRDATGELWAKPLAGGDVAVLLFNRGEEPLELSTTAAEVGLPGVADYDVADVWTGEASRSAQEFRADVAPHDVKLWRVTTRVT